MSDLPEWRFRYTKDVKYHFYDTPYSPLADEYDEDMHKTGRKIKIPTCNASFHNDWNWIHCAIEKIENTVVKTKGDIGVYSKNIQEYEILFTVQLEGKQCFINMDKSPQFSGTHEDFLKLYDCRNTDKKEAAYRAIVSFVKWYNKIV